MKLYHKSFLLLAVLLLFFACDSDPAPNFETYEATGYPSSPDGLSATVKYTTSSSKIVLSWSVSDNATDYEVWRIESSSYEGVPSERESLSSYGFTKQGVSVSGSGGTRSAQDTVSGAYVYTVVALRDLSEDPIGSSSSGVLYSSPSDPVEGAAIDSSESISVHGAIEDGAIVLSWSVPELLSVLSPGERLGEYTFSVGYRLSGSSDDYTTEDMGTEESFSLDTYTAGSSYDFIVTLSIFTDTYTKTVTSDTYTVKTWEE